jgi:hypothetical protein
MSSTKQQPPLFHIGDWVKFNYGPTKVYAKIVEDRGPLGVHGRRLYRVQLDDDQLYRVELDDDSRKISAFEMPENELETALPPIRLSYRVQYYRPGNADVWDATTRKDRVLKGVKAKGAVGYSTASYEEETTQDQRYATVMVLLEVDPRFVEAGFELAPGRMRELAERAAALADEMFLSRHPRAKIKHFVST